MLKTIADIPALTPPTERKLKHPAGGFITNYDMRPEHLRSVVLVFPALGSLPPNPTHQQLAPGIVLTTAWALVRDAKHLTPGFRWLWGNEFAARVLGETVQVFDAGILERLQAARERIAALETSVAQAVAVLKQTSP